ncbi:hypothetical protein chiPu_0009002 [Chiloscyllium punctatum]|uniref:Solute carrier family 15 member 2 n=1 Tax=Chiloscyllium punctatum TaxID=137246 RepID=A0A401SJJ9_CHIPU|nr:hypothetical protein [Chiloscyllium punctatum]
MGKNKIDGEIQKELSPPEKQKPRLCGTSYPLSILFVVVNEFCERFSYYGMKAILTLYFTNFLYWDDDLSTAIYHAFSGFAYFTPVLGALIADSWLGKFNISILIDVALLCFPAEVQCFGGDCYALAFGVPAALMVIALVVFISGSGLYKKLPPQGNILVEVCSCIGFSIANRWRHRSKNYPRREHWLDWAREKYPKHVIEEIKMVTRVLFLYLPLPMFWALFDQQGSRWTLQAARMNSNFTINALLIVIFIPIFDMGIYPLVRKCKINFTPLRRMTLGMVFAALAFVAAAIVEVGVQKTVMPEPVAKESYIQFLNLADENINVTVQGRDDFPVTIAPFQDPDSYTKLQLDAPNQAFSFNITYKNNTEICHRNISERSAYSILMYTEVNTPHCTLLEDQTSKPQKGKAAVRIVNAFTEDLNVTMGDVNFGTVYKNFGSSLYKTMDRGYYKLVYQNATAKQVVDVGLVDFGAVYTLILSNASKDSSLKIWKTEDVKANTMHIAWQIPQYVLMSAGEVMFSITGVEFSYSQVL